MIVGWTWYFNHFCEYEIDADIIKGIMYVETKMGYYQETPPSPNANSTEDVMQVLDPRNSTIYDYADIYPEKVYIKCTTEGIIMEKTFGQIFDFQYRRADKLENSSYLEELIGLLAKVASCIDDETKYFFGDKYYLKSHTGEPNSSFKYFIEDLKNSFYYSTGSKINIIRGRAGIGKSLFFAKGIQRLVRINKGHNDNYIYMGVDFKNIDNDKNIEFYEEWIYKKIHVNAIDAIRTLGDNVFECFEKAYNKFGTTFQTPNTVLFPLKYFCQKIQEKYDRPCIIVFDNIDLASVKTQKNVFDATVNICNTFNMFMRQNRIENCYRVYFVMRPETHLRYNEGQLGNVINFPLPNVLKITLAIVKKVLEETAEEFDNTRNLPCNVSCADV